jgi:prephenate dehydrogenase
MIDTLAIVGVGLLGGSVALAARARHVARHLIGVDAREACRDYLRQRGLVDEVEAKIGPSVVKADLILICTPVNTIADHARELLSAGARGAISDVGSTKAMIVKEVEKGRGDRLNFVGGHPLAGSDRSGPEHATETLFEDRVTFLTPTNNTDPRTTDLLTEFWNHLGARVEIVDADEHDRIVATTSHLPHLVAFALAATMPEGCQKYVGTGWRDTTRLAGSDPRLWTAIALSNRKPLADALKAINDRVFNAWVALLCEDEAKLLELFEEGRKARHALGS